MRDWTPRSGHVSVDVVEGRVAVVRLDRPDKLNALTIPMLHDLRDALQSLDGPAAVLTGVGRAFSAGDDIGATEALEGDAVAELMRSFQDLTRTILATSFPVVAALNGIAVGGAAELVLCCDARVGCAASDFLFPENALGLTISNASSYLLPRLLGSRALPLVLDGDRISGSRAHHLGLIDYMVDAPKDVVPGALEIVRRWVERGLATPFHLRLLRPPADAIEAALRRESEIGLEVWQSGAAAEGMRRFLAGRGAGKPPRR